jgi:hypothetical protein
MQRGIGRRITMLERSIPVPMTADLFLARAEKHARRTGTSLETAIQSLVGSVTDDELDHLAAVFERVVFGDDTAARDAAKRKVFAAAGYPDWANRSSSEASN